MKMKQVTAYIITLISMFITGLIMPLVLSFLGTGLAAAEFGIATASKYTVDTLRLVGMVSPVWMPLAVGYITLIMCKKYLSIDGETEETTKI
jgi:hypothetical protein